MITGERRRAIVGKDGTVTITELDLPEGTIVDVLIYVDERHEL